MGASGVGASGTSAKTEAKPNKPAVPKTPEEISKELAAVSRQLLEAVRTTQNTAAKLGDPYFQPRIEFAEGCAYNKQKEKFKATLTGIGVSPEVAKRFCDQQYANLILEMHRATLSSSGFSIGAWKTKIDETFKSLPEMVAKDANSQAANEQLAKQQAAVISVKTVAGIPTTDLDTKLAAATTAQAQVAAKRTELETATQAHQKTKEQIQEYQDLIKQTTQAAGRDQEQLAALQTKLAAKNQEMKDIGTAVKSSTTARKQIVYNDIQRLDHEIKGIEGRVKAHKDAFEKFTTAAPTRLKDLDDQIKVKEAELKTAQEAKSPVDADIQRIKTEMKPLQDEAAGYGPFMRLQQLKTENAPLETVHNNLNAVNQELQAARELKPVDFAMMSQVLAREVKDTVTKKEAEAKSIPDNPVFNAALVTSLETRLRDQLQAFVDSDNFKKLNKELQSELPPRQLEIKDIATCSREDLFKKADQLSNVVGVEAIEHSNNLLKLMDVELQRPGKTLTAEATVNLVEGVQNLAVKQFERGCKEVLNNSAAAVQTKQTELGTAVDAQVGAQKTLQAGLNACIAPLEAGAAADASKKTDLDAKVAAIKEIKEVPDVSAKVAELSQKIKAETDELSNKATLDQMTANKKSVERQKQITYAMFANPGLGSRYGEYYAVDADLQTRLRDGRGEDLSVAGLSVTGQRLTGFQSGMIYKRDGDRFGVAYKEKKNADGETEYSFSAVAIKGGLNAIGWPNTNMAKEGNFKDATRASFNLMAAAGITRNIDITPPNIKDFKGSSDDQKLLTNFVSWKMDVVLERQAELFTAKKLPSEAELKAGFKDSFLIVKEGGAPKVFFVNDEGKAQQVQGNQKEIEKLIKSNGLLKSAGVALDKAVKNSDARPQRVQITAAQMKGLRLIAEKDPNMPPIPPRISINKDKLQMEFNEWAAQGRITMKQKSKLEAKLAEIIPDTPKKAFVEGMDQKATVDEAKKPESAPGTFSAGSGMRATADASAPDAHDVLIKLEEKDMPEPSAPVASLTGDMKADEKKEEKEGLDASLIVPAGSSSVPAGEPVVPDVASDTEESEAGSEKDKNEKEVNEEQEEQEEEQEHVNEDDDEEEPRGGYSL